MKRYLFMIICILPCIFVCGKIFAQPQKKKHTRIILDGKPTTRGLREIGIDTMLNIDVLVNQKVVAMTVQDTKLEYTDTKRGDTTIVAITRPYAIGQYKLKFGRFSKEYKAYTDTCATGDGALNYVLNNTELKRDDEGIFLKTLYNIPANTIRSVSFRGRHYMGVGKNEEPIVVISTKKY